MVTYFEKIARNQDETQLEHRMSNFQSVELCSSHLSSRLPSLRAPMSNVRLMDITFSELRDRIDEICQNIEVHKGNHHENDNSLNSTTSSLRRDDLITISPEELKGVIKSAVQQSRSNERSGYSRVGQSSNSRGSSRSRSPSRSSRSSNSFNQRGRSRSNDRQCQAGSSSKRRRQHLQFAPSMNSTQAVDEQSEDDGNDDDAAIADSVLGDYFKVWASR